MTSYKIDVLKSAERDIRKIDKQNVKRILKGIRKLENNPFPSNSASLKSSSISYRLRVGDYRILYDVNEEENVITIYYIRHRKDAYRQI